MRLTSHAHVGLALTDPRFAVPPVPPEPGPLGWLRGAVARFGDGPAHTRRRALAVACLPTDLGELRAEAYAHAAAAAGDVRYVPVRVLATRLAVPPDELDATVAAVRTVAAAYQPGGTVVPGADEAVAHLVELLGPAADEETAARVGVLVQACEATAGLIAAALRAAPSAPTAHPVEAVLAETLRHDPPVRGTRRVCRADVDLGPTVLTTGTVVALDLAAANRDPAVFADPDVFDAGRPDRARHLTLGAGPHRCPGRDPALALAAGVVTAAWAATR